MKSPKKIMILFATTFASMLVLITAYGLIFLAMEKKTEATSTLTESSREISGKESHVGSAVLSLKTEAHNLEKLSTYFIKEQEIVSFAKDIEALGPQSGTVLKIESLDPGMTEKSVPFLDFRIKATGGFSDIVRLMTLLQNFPGNFEWRTLQLVHLEDGASMLWEANASLTALNFIKE